MAETMASTTDTTLGITKQTIIRAVEALRKAYDTQKSDNAGKQALIEESGYFFLDIVQKKISPKQYTQLSHALPHPFRECGTADVCLFIKDISREKNFDNDVAVTRFKEYLRNVGVTGITEVFTFHQLKSEYKTYEAKRKLLNRYEVFLADNRIYGKLAAVLGTKFFSKNKFPVKVDMTESDGLKDRIKTAIESTYIRINGRGPQMAVRVGVTDQSSADVAENVSSLVSFAAQHVPYGSENLRTISVRLGQLSLPIYVNTSTPNAIEISRPKAAQGFMAAPEEVSTVMRGRVRVTREGNVKVVKSTQKKKRGRKPKNANKME